MQARKPPRFGTIEAARWDPHKDAQDYLDDLYRLLKGLDVQKLDEHLPPYRAKVLHDLQQALRGWEDQLVNILNFRYWDVSRLKARSPDIAKPRVDVYHRITTHQNLSVTWQPTGWLPVTHMTDHDFRGWGAHPLNELSYIGQRPNNELLFIHALESLRPDPPLRSRSRGWEALDLGPLLRARRSFGPPTALQIDSLLLFAVRALSMRMLRFLDRFCEVRTVEDFYFEFDDKGRLTHWGVCNIADQWAKTFTAKHGLSLEEFAKRLGEGTDKDIQRLSRVLRQRGHASMTPKTVAALAERLRRFNDYPGLG